jgi:hypothetical protein
MKQWHFYDRVYRRWVCLFIGEFQEFYDDLKRDEFSELDLITPAKGLTVELNDENNTAGQRCTIIWMPVYEAATLVHELAHLVMFQFDQIGIPISKENTEAFAFYQEYWWTEIQRARRKYPAGRPPKDAK